MKSQPAVVVVQVPASEASLAACPAEAQIDARNAAGCAVLATFPVAYSSVVCVELVDWRTQRPGPVDGTGAAGSVADGACSAAVAHVAVKGNVEAEGSDAEADSTTAEGREDTHGEVEDSVRMDCVPASASAAAACTVDSRSAAWRDD